MVEKKRFLCACGERFTFEGLLEHRQTKHNDYGDWYDCLNKN